MSNSLTLCRSHTFFRPNTIKIKALRFCAFLFLLTGFHAFADTGAAESWQGSGTNSDLSFHFIQAGAENSGKFDNFSVDVQTAATTGEPTSLKVAVNVKSLDTDDADRDDMLRNSLFFDVKQFPAARFESTRIVKTSQGYQASGNLTIKDITKAVNLHFTLNPTGDAAQAGRELLGKMSLKRLDYEVGLGEWESDTFVGNQVDLVYKVALKKTS